MDDPNFGGAGKGWPSVDRLEQLVRADLQTRWPSEVLEFTLSLRGDVIVVRGRVASLEVKAAATRALLAYDRVFKIENALDVTGFFAPASSEDDEALFARTGGEASAIRNEQLGAGTADLRGEQPPLSGTPSWQAGGVHPMGIVCHPALEVVGEVRAGARIEMLVDLHDQAPEIRAGEPIRLEVDTAWQTMLVDVQIVSGQLEDIGPLAGCVVVRRDGTTVAARFAATVSAQASEDGYVKITAAFMHGTRFCGAAGRTFPIEKEAGTGKLDHVKAPELPAHGPIDLSWHGGAAMTVTIFSVGNGRLRWYWTTFPPLEAARIPPSGCVQIDDARDYSASLLRACPAFAASDSRRRMRAIGEQIWRRAPNHFQSAYRALRASLGANFPIQFIIDEPHVPWEIMYPETEFLPGADHLYLDHPVARWPLTNDRLPAKALPAGRVESFVPNYPGGATLPAARREQEWLVKTLGANAASALKADFIALLESGSGVGIIHFAGHGQADTGKRDCGLLMEDGPVVLDDIMQGAVTLGDSCRTTVVLNACEAANEQLALGFVEGWGPGLARKGFGAIIAPLWRVKDDASASFMISALEGLTREGRPLGEAVARARSSTAGSSATAFAYMVYGDVMARVAAVTR